MSEKKQHFLGEFALLFVTLLWGATFVIVKESLNDISTMLFITFRFFIASILLLPFIFKKIFSIRRENLIAGILLGLFLFLGFSTQTVGLKYTTATKSAFITGSIVVMVPILQTIIEKRPPTKGSLIGISLVFLGILFLSTGDISIANFISELGGNFNIGDLLTLICAFFFSLHIVYLDIVSKKYDYLTLVFLQIIVTALFAFAFSFVLSWVNIEQKKIILTDYLWFGLIYTAIFATLITTTLQTRFQKEVTPAKAGIIYSFEPIFAGFFAFFILSEKITNFGIVGSVLIFSGLIISELLDNYLKRTNG